MLLCESLGSKHTRHYRLHNVYRKNDDDDLYEYSAKCLACRCSSSMGLKLLRGHLFANSTDYDIVHNRKPVFRTLSSNFVSQRFPNPALPSGVCLKQRQTILQSTSCNKLSTSGRDIPSTQTPSQLITLNLFRNSHFPINRHLVACMQ